MNGASRCPGLLSTCAATTPGQDARAAGFLLCPAVSSVIGYACRKGHTRTSFNDQQGKQACCRLMRAVGWMSWLRACRVRVAIKACISAWPRHLLWRCLSCGVVKQWVWLLGKVSKALGCRQFELPAESSSSSSRLRPLEIDCHPDCVHITSPKQAFVGTKDGISCMNKACRKPQPWWNKNIAGQPPECQNLGG